MPAPTGAEPVRGTVAFSQDTLANDWRAAQVDAVRRVLAKYADVEFVVRDARGSTALQILQIEELARAGVDVLLTSPRESAALTPVIGEVHRRGLPVILLDRGVEGDLYTAFVRPDNRPIGRAAAKRLISTLEQRGVANPTILALEGVPGASPTMERRAGFADIVAHHPQIQLVRRTANFLRSDAIWATEQVVSGGIHFDAIYAHSDSMAIGARIALRKASIDPASIPIVGIDYIEEARRAIRSNQQLASYTYATGGTEGAQLALDVLRGKPVTREIILKSLEVTRENVEQIEPIF